MWPYLNGNAPSQPQYPHQCTPPVQQLLHPIVSEHTWKQAILTVHTGSDTLLGLLVTHVFHYLLDHFGLGWKFHLNPFSLPKTLRVSYGCGTLLSQRANTALLQEIRWVAILLRRIRAPCPKIVVARLGLKLTGEGVGWKFGRLPGVPHNEQW